MTRVHHTDRPTTFHAPWLIVFERRVVACDNPDVAHRIAELLDRHGLADVPNTAEEVTG